MGECPVCAAEIELADDAMAGEIIVCDDCGAEVGLGFDFVGEADDFGGALRTADRALDLSRRQGNTLNMSADGNGV